MSSIGTPTHKVSAGSGTDAASYTTASIAVTAGDVLWVAVTNASLAGTADALSGIAGTLGSQLEWNYPGSVLMNSSFRARTTWAWAVCPATVSGTLILQFGGVTQASAQWTIFTDTGIDMTNAVVSVQTVQTAGTNPSITLSPAPAPNSMILVAGHCNDSVAMTVGSGYTVLGGGQVMTTPTVIHTVEYDLTPGTVANFVKSGATNKAAISIEVREIQTTDTMSWRTGGAISGVAGIVVGRPLKVADQGLLVAHCQSAATAANTWTPPAGEGWVLAVENTASGVSSAVFYRLATASEAASYTFTRSNSTNNAGVTVVYLEPGTFDPAAPVAAASVVGDLGNSTSLVLAGVTAAEDDTLLLQLGSTISLGTYTWTPPGAQTVLSVGNMIGRAVGYFIATEQVNAGATGTRSWAHESVIARGAMVAINPVPSPSVVTPPDVVVGGVKKTGSSINVIVGGAKKTVTSVSVIEGGVKKPIS